VTATFEFQRRLLEQNRAVLEQSIAAGTRSTEGVVDGVAGRESVGRRAVELQRETVHAALDALEASVPGAEEATAGIRASVDEQFDQLLAVHEEAFENVTVQLQDGAEAYDEFTRDYLAAVDEQLGLVAEAHKQLEAESVEATERLAAQLEQLREQVQESPTAVQPARTGAPDS